LGNFQISDNVKGPKLCCIIVVKPQIVFIDLDGVILVITNDSPFSTSPGFHFDTPSKLISRTLEGGRDHTLGKDKEG
jgi:hypothetical protein